MTDYTNLITHPIPLTEEECSLFRSNKKFENKHRWISILKDKLNDVLQHPHDPQISRQPPMDIAVNYDNIKVERQSLISFPIVIRNVPQDEIQQISRQLEKVLPDIIHRQSLIEYPFRQQQTLQRQKQFLYRQEPYKQFIRSNSLHSKKSPYHEKIINLIHTLKPLPPFGELQLYSMEQRKKVLDGMFENKEWRGILDDYIKRYINDRFDELAKLLAEQDIKFVKQNNILKTIKVFKWVYADFPTPKLAKHRLQIVVFLSHQRKRDNVLVRLHPYQPGKLLAKRQSGDGEQQVKEFNILQGQSQQQEEEGEDIPKIIIQQLQRDGTTSQRVIPFSTIIKKS